MEKKGKKKWLLRPLITDELSENGREKVKIKKKKKKKQTNKQKVLSMEGWCMQKQKLTRLSCPLQTFLCFLLVLQDHLVIEE
jgi:hypothetical protein